jgi:cell division protease FtsH
VTALPPPPPPGTPTFLPPPPPPAPVPPPPSPQAAGPKEVRKRLGWWDRSKFVLGLVILFFFFVWADQAEYRVLDKPFGNSIEETFRDKWWIPLLLGIELLRQVHYLVSEQWSGYHRFWTHKVFGRFDRVSHKLNPWNRFRLARTLKVLLGVFCVGLVLGAFWGLDPVTAIAVAPGRLLSSLPQFLQIILYLVFWIGFQFVLIVYFATRGGVETYFPEDIKTRFSDVWGQDPTLNRVRENVMYLEKPDLIEAKGGYVPGGILLYGPPGTGKTLMAEAVAGETGKPFVMVEPGALNSGMAPLKVKFLFRKLRKLSLKYGGAIVFFDEADSLGRRALNTGQGGMFAERQGGAALPFDARWVSPAAQQFLWQEQLRSFDDVEVPRSRRSRFFFGMGGMGGGALEVLLTELNGMKKPRGFFNRIVRRTLGMRPKEPPRYRMLVMMATNLPEALDPALLRPGRIDRIYRVGYPSKEGRKRTFEGYFAKVRHTLTDDDLDKLAVMMPYATGAIIKDIVNEALIYAIRNEREVITWQDVIKAKHLKTLGPPSDQEFIDRERHAVAIHESCHAVAAYRVQKNLVIDVATIEPGQGYLGMVSQVRPEDQLTGWRSEYEADIIVSLASLAGERMFFGEDSSSGVSGDLRQATAVAIQMEGYWGMGTTVASHGITQQVGIGGGEKQPKGPDQSNALRGHLGQRVEDLLQQMYRRTEYLLEKNRREILALAHALETHRTITGDDVRAIIEGTVGPTVDGRVYQSASFLRQAEAYHERVVEAHRAHAKVEAALPVLLPVSSPPVSSSASVPDPSGGRP